MMATANAVSSAAVVSSTDAAMTAVISHIPHEAESKNCHTAALKEGLFFVNGAGWCSDQGLRPEMEDGSIFVDNIGGFWGSTFCAIFDGHGGVSCVDYLENSLHEYVCRELHRYAEGTRFELQVKLHR